MRGGIIAKHPILETLQGDSITDDYRCRPKLRRGGEYDEGWHKAGMSETQDDTDILSFLWNKTDIR